MKNLLKIIITLIAVYTPIHISAQTYIKLNAPCALVGIINAQAEFVISQRSSVAFDFTYSPWKSLPRKHFEFGIALCEYRYYFKESTKGWYVSANAGMTGFDMYRPQFFKNNTIISRQDQYGKGFGVMTGIGVGWEHHLSKRWIMDIFISLDRIWSWYNRYNNDGTIIMNPQGHEHYPIPDPFNGSAEYMPIKGGISFGYKIFK